MPSGRTQEPLYERNGIVITRDTIKELEQEYIQIKGKNRTEVLNLSKRLHVAEHHVPNSFLDLYNQKLKKRPPARAVKK